jgi:lipid II:glycine glycyltransferase (peptidoglycan interpeptide bridge formation enzyme)
VREATAEEQARWDKLVAANPDGGNVLQGKAFAETKAKFGWTPFYALHGPSEALSEQIAVCYHKRHIRGLGELWYAPKGPGVANAAQLEEVCSALKRIKGVFAIKVDPELRLSETNSDRLLHMGLVPARDVQLNIATVAVDLRLPEEDIMALFKQKTRYNVRLAVKKGVRVEADSLSQENIDLVYAMMRETYDRAGVYTRGKRYFETFWRLHAEKGAGQLFLATLDSEVLAAAFVTYLGTKALYKDGASTRLHRDAQAPYLLQWEVMRWLKLKGVESYDLHGVPPKARLQDSTHRLYPLVQFKTGFNPEVTEFIGTYDLVLDPSRYKQWTRFGERAAMAWSHRFRSELFY